MPSLRQHVELFHLLFLRALMAKAEDKNLFSLKGGCNLRFFFDSIRYSEDIDIDVVHLSVDTLKTKVERLLVGPLVRAPLAARGVQILDISAPKQTETTQRWKIGLTVGSTPVRTKIEFSRRNDLGGAVVAPVSPGCVEPLGLAPFLARHYPAAIAVAQKVAALAGRATPQARDVFDLHLLFPRPDAAGVALSDELRARLPAAIDNAMSLGFDDFQGAVAAWLDPAQADLYDDPGAWSLIQETVIDRLEALA